ncbi:membrane protein [Knoellia sinensis KCTC 19936]|uniref:Membrane protein n=1 Tax=Knoellia sinensis KCTC 19936 TaxID=1385520 RepID=A0A0A0J5N3_9MICO|nr:membrane protein [Knoellia sinensis KCTC 19936]
MAPALDILAVVIFALVGRRSHAHGITLTGVLETAAPFVCGTAAGWLLASLTLDASPRTWQFGAVVVVATVVIGMLLRRLAASGTAPSFIIVATIFLAVTMLGWRLIAKLMA